jgi:signal transduction histidine kinase
VVLAREEERRRLRRDLHDGLGPTLSAIVTQADVASLRLERGDADAAALVDRLRSTSSAAIIGLRRVVEGLRPVGVDELGLDGALRELAAALSVPGGVTVELICDALPELPAAVELAGYRIASEAMTNAVRHARARAITIRIVADPATLRVEVIDDGDGFVPAAVPAGLGLQSMRERAEELGGRLDVTSGDDGTYVRAVLPRRDHAGDEPAW